MQQQQSSWPVRTIQLNHSGWLANRMVSAGRRHSLRHRHHNHHHHSYSYSAKNNATDNYYSSISREVFSLGRLLSDDNNNNRLATSICRSSKRSVVATYTDNNEVQGAEEETGKGEDDRTDYKTAMLCCGRKKVLTLLIISLLMHA